MGADSISRAISFNLSLPQFPASKYHQECAHGYAADFLEVAPELLPVCFALLAKFLGVFGLVAAALLAFVPEFLGHKPFLFPRIFCLCIALNFARSALSEAMFLAIASISAVDSLVGRAL